MVFTGKAVGVGYYAVLFSVSVHCPVPGNTERMEPFVTGMTVTLLLHLVVTYKNVVSYDRTRSYFEGWRFGCQEYFR